MSDDGGPAYPQVGTVFRDEPGVSVRDYFAAHALAAITPMINANPGPDSAKAYRARIAVEVYLIADAMLAERSKR
jgi:hypothetical protein